MSFTRSKICNVKYDTTFLVMSNMTLQIRLVLSYVTSNSHTVYDSDIRPEGNP
jgi:hypothetical protein